PNAPNADIQNKIYEGWLYAAVAAPDGSLVGLFLTKDNGATWTLVHTGTFPSLNNNLAIPSNDQTRTDYTVINSPSFPQGNYNISLAVDPKNPNIVYFGGTSDGQSSGLVRVDVTGIYD